MVPQTPAILAETYLLPDDSGEIAKRKNACYKPANTEVDGSDTSIESQQFTVGGHTRLIRLISC
jgi:hypothetical protein